MVRRGRSAGVEWQEGERTVRVGWVERGPGRTEEEEDGEGVRTATVWERRADAAGPRGRGGLGTRRGEEKEVV